MQTLYYTWVIQRISELIRMFIPKELIVLIVNLMKISIVEYIPTSVNIKRITVAPIRDGMSCIHYNNAELLLKTHTWWYDMNKFTSNCSKYVTLHLNNQPEYISLEKFMMRIDTFLQSHVAKKQLFGKNWIGHTYSPCIESMHSPYNFFIPVQKKIQMYLCRETTRLIRVTYDTEEDIPFTTIEDIADIIAYEKTVVFVFLLKIWITSTCGKSTYGVEPEIKTIKYYPRNRTRFDFSFGDFDDSEII